MWPPPSLLPRKDNPPWLIPPQGLGHPAGVTPLLVLLQAAPRRCSAPGGTRDKLPATPGMPCWRCLLTGCKQKAFSFQSTTNQSPTLQKSPLSSPPCSDIPSTRGFVLKMQPRLSPLAVRSSWCQSPAREPEPVIFIRGCSLWGPSAASQEKQATGENLSLLMAFPPAAVRGRAAPSPEDEHQRGQLVSPVLSSNKSNCLENT